MASDDPLERLKEIADEYRADGRGATATKLYDILKDLVDWYKDIQRTQAYLKKRTEGEIDRAEARSAEVEQMRDALAKLLHTEGGALALRQGIREVLWPPEDRDEVAT